jgi:hypothetical protein
VTGSQDEFEFRIELEESRRDSQTGQEHFVIEEERERDCDGGGDKGL